MGFLKIFSCFQFNNNAVFDNQISKILTDILTFIKDGDRDLSGDT